MNKGTCERLTGCRVRKLAPGQWALFEEDGDVPLAEAKGYKDPAAIQDLHNQFWKQRRNQVFMRDNFKCVECGSPFQLECDHIENRSRMGTHKMENLQTLCRRCHYDKTNLLGRWAKRKNA